MQALVNAGSTIQGLKENRDCANSHLDSTAERGKSTRGRAERVLDAWLLFEVMRRLRRRCLAGQRRRGMATPPDRRVGIFSKIPAGRAFPAASRPACFPGVRDRYGERDRCCGRMHAHLIPDHPHQTTDQRHAPCGARSNFGAKCCAVARARNISAGSSAIASPASASITNDLEG